MGLSVLLLSARVAWEEAAQLGAPPSSAIHPSWPLQCSPFPSLLAPPLQLGKQIAVWVAFLSSYLFIYFFINLFILFIYLWLRWVFVAARGLSLVAVSGGYSSLWCAGFSLWWLLLLWSTGSRCVGFSSCGSRALEYRLSSCGSRAQ